MICYRLCTPAFHTVLPLDDVVVFHEITNGPYSKNEAVMAGWAPDQLDKLYSFLIKAALAGTLPAKVRQELCARSPT